MFLHNLNMADVKLFSWRVCHLSRHFARQIMTSKSFFFRETEEKMVQGVIKEIE